MQLDLDTLAAGRPGLSEAKGASLAEAASVCLEAQVHRSPVTFSVHGDHEGTLQLAWRKPTEQMRQTYNDPAEATEDGACAIGLMIAESLYGLRVVSRSRKRSGFDYWVGPTQGNLYQNGVRLEVTGILCGDDAQVKARMQEKLARLDRYHSHLNALVIVVEFGTPQVRSQTK